MRAIVRPTNHLFVSIGPLGLIVLSPFIVIYLIFAIYAAVAYGLFIVARFAIEKLAFAITYVHSYWRTYQADRRLPKVLR